MTKSDTPLDGCLLTRLEKPKRLTSPGFLQGWVTELGVTLSQTLKMVSSHPMGAPVLR